MSEFVNRETATDTGAANWRATLVAIVGVALALIFLLEGTATSMVDTWYRSETYTHGFVILPIAIWLTWQKRDYLARYTPQPSYWMLTLVVLSLASWSVAKLTGVLVIEQASLVALLISSIVALVGLQVAKLLAFPLFFLFFAVPMGEDLVPVMMEYTADFTVGALKLTGIPVYREGLWFSLPTGDWSVVEACSGVRYLIASATLGTMYAYITYQTLWKRLVFVALSFLVPVFANGVRAYLIVMTGHLSDMRLATGVDHMFYGWVFFGIVMFLLFWIGGFWQEEHAPPDAAVPPSRTRTTSAVKNARLAVSLLIVGLSATSVWAVERLGTSEIKLETPLTLPVEIGDWKRVPDRQPLWKALHPATAQTVAAVYQRERRTVQVFIAFYPVQGQGMEAISSANKIAERVPRRTSLPAPIDGGNSAGLVGKQEWVTVSVEGKIHSHLVSHWYRIAGRSLTNRYLGKAYEALARIYPGRTDGAWIAVTTPVQEPAEIRDTQQLLVDFIADFAPLLDQAIDKSLGLHD